MWQWNESPDRVELSRPLSAKLLDTFGDREARLSIVFTKTEPLQRIEVFLWYGKLSTEEVQPMDRWKRLEQLMQTTDADAIRMLWEIVDAEEMEDAL